MDDITPVSTELVLIGGGHAHIEVLRRFGMRPEPGLRITLISRETHTPYSGMLPGLIAGHYTFDQAHIDLAPLANMANARLYHDEVVGLDLVTRQVLCRDHPPVSFDLLSIDTGSSPDTSVAGRQAANLAVKPVSNFYARWQRLREEILSSDRPMKIAVVGAGAGGLELLMSVRYRLLEDLKAQNADVQRLQFTVVSGNERILPTHNTATASKYRAALERAGIEVITGFNVISSDANLLRSQDGRELYVDQSLWVTTAVAPHWPKEAGLATDELGFIEVDADLQTRAWPGIFAAGDVAAVLPYPRPKSGVFAVRQGPPLANNLRRASRGKATKPYRPQREFLSLISTGNRYAVASRGNWSIGGKLVWHWKDFIDRRFMRRYQDLPVMDEVTPDDDGLLVDHMRCGGCGSKIGAEVLQEALSSLAPAARDDVLIGLGQTDDAAVVRVPHGALAVHSVDAFRSFIDDPWMLGRVAAVHGLSDIYAMGATPQTALAMVTLPFGKSSTMRDDLVQLMRGALEVFERENTILVGGHTGEGPELAVGFALNGYVDEADLVRKRGALSGDVLILTQALGSGVLFAASMRGQAQARMLDAALTAMTTSKAAAAMCFRQHQVHAMTDVTGFGLIGHLREMLDDESCGAEIDLSRLPIYPGVEELAARDITSSLQQENRRAERFVSADQAVRNHPRYILSFDPQTAGGLLAALPADQADDCLAQLHQAGYGDACVIGQVTAGDSAIKLRA